MSQEDRTKTRSGRAIQYKNIELVERTLFKKREKKIIDSVKKILEKTDLERTSEEIDYLNSNSEIVKKLEDLKKCKLNKLAHNEIQLDDLNILNFKCEQLANYINSSEYCVCYTGAGISTSSSIPDYRLAVLEFLANVLRLFQITFSIEVQMVYGQCLKKE